MTVRAPALAALLLFAPACVSTGGGAAAPAAPPEGGNPPAAAEDPAKPGDARKPDAALDPQGKSALYGRIDSLAESWQRANAEPGGRAADDARALETAIAREAWTNLEAVLADLKSSSNPRWRSSAARGLGFVVDPRARPALEAALGEGDARLLSSVLVSLARHGDADTGDRAVAALLRHADPVVRGNAALCLARVFQARVRQGLPAVSPAERMADMEAELAVLLFDPADPIVRGNAAQALGDLGSPGAEDALLNRLRDDSTFVRIKAARALAHCGSPRADPPLLDALAREPEENVRTMLALALGAIAERQGKVPPHADLGTDAAKWRAWLGR